MSEGSTVLQNIRNCARCGGDHADPVIAEKLARPFAPPEAGGLAWTHWARCPTNGEPILVIVVESDGKEPS